MKFLHSAVYLILSITCLLICQAQALVTITGPSCIPLNQSTTFNYANASNQASQWMGVYKYNQSPGGAGVTSIRWAYTPGTSGSFNVPAITTPGSYSVYFFNSDTSFTYQARFNFDVGVTVTGVSQNYISTTTTSNIVINGTGFESACSAKLTKSGYPDRPIAITSPHTLSLMNASINMVGAATGYWNLVVTNSAGQSATLTNALNASSSVPTLTSITPSFTSVGSTVTVTATGTNLSDCTIKLANPSFGTGITPTAITNQSATSITATFQIPNPIAPDSTPRKFFVTNTSSQSASINFPIHQPTPILTSVTPRDVIHQRTATVTINGADFTTLSTAKLQKSGSPDLPLSISVDSSSSITAGFSAFGMPVGDWDLVLTNSTGQSCRLPNAVTIHETTPLPQQHNPASATTGTVVTLTTPGYYYTPPTAVRLKKSGCPDIIGVNPALVDPTYPHYLSATFDLTNASPGAWTYEATTSTGLVGTSPMPFNINEITPILSSASPSSAATGSVAATLTLTGQQFTPGSTAKLITSTGTAIPATSVTTLSPTTILATFSLNQAPLGLCHLTLTNCTGQSSTLNNTFTITQPPIQLAAVTPASTTTETSPTLTLTGANFTPDTTLTFSSPGLPDVSASPVNFVDTNTLTATFDFSQITTPSTWNLTATRPDGSTTTALNAFELKLPDLVITNLSSYSDLTTLTTERYFVLTIEGRNFTPTTTARLRNIDTNFICNADAYGDISSQRIDAGFPLHTAPAGNYAVEIIDGARFATTDMILTVHQGKPAPKPKIWWHLNETSGLTITDSSDNHLNATASGSPTWTPNGHDEGAIQLNGTTDYIRQPVSDFPKGPFTVSIWVKSGGAQSNIACSVFSNTNANTNPDTFQFDVSNGYNFSSSAGAAGSGSFGPIVVGEWTHLVASCNGTSTDLYYNGNFVRSVPSASNNFNTFGVGINRNGVRKFNGCIDEVRVYPAALSANDVWNIYQISGYLPLSQPSSPKSFATWLSQNAPASDLPNHGFDLNADPDHDGRPLFMEYALQSNPNAHNPPFELHQDSSGVWFDFQRPQRGQPDVHYQAESSEDLLHWSPTILEVIQPGNPETLRVRDPLSSGNPKKRFVRLKVAPN